MEHELYNLIQKFNIQVSVSENCDGPVVSSKTAVFKRGILLINNQKMLHEMGMDTRIINSSGVLSHPFVRHLAMKTSEYFETRWALSVSYTGGFDLYYSLYDSEGDRCESRCIPVYNVCVSDRIYAGMFNRFIRVYGN